MKELAEKKIGRLTPPPVTCEMVEAGVWEIEQYYGVVDLSSLAEKV